MRFPLFKAQKEPGFRLSLGDVFLGAALGGLSWVLSSVPDLAPIWPLPVHVFLTYFCFCNVFRIGLKQEVCWMAVAVAAFAACLASGIDPYPSVIPPTVAMMVVSITWSALRGRYNGVFHRRVACLRAKRPLSRPAGEC